RKLLIFVNPRSGPGKALQIFQQRVIPILAEAHVEYSLIVTATICRQKQSCASIRRHMCRFELLGWNCNRFWRWIVVVFNGLMERTDWKSAIKTPVGVVPGGSGNGLARAIGHALEEEPYLQHAVLSSSLNLVSGRTKLMDIIRVEMRSETCYSFLSIGWGLLADIDIESEKMRSIGELRFALWSLAKIIGLRSYSGRVSYIPANTDPNPHLTRSATFPETSDESVQRAGDPRYSVNGEYDDASLLPPLNQPIPCTWMSLEDSFLLVYVVYQTHIGSEVFFAPSARLDDGIMWLLTVRKGVSRKQLLSFMLSLESGEHTRCPFVGMIPVRAVRIEPFTDSGHMTVDGENVECGPMQAEVLPSLARIMIEFFKFDRLSISISISISAIHSQLSPVHATIVVGCSRLSMERPIGVGVLVLRR
uniref:DAGKc domain-containing protein n=1 Tax=Strigamia maritima TaxID=126957 RepID=T1JKM2_STRMM